MKILCQFILAKKRKKMIENWHKVSQDKVCNSKLAVWFSQSPLSKFEADFICSNDLSSMGWKIKTKQKNKNKIKSFKMIFV